jgi:hypothetical protein
MQPFPEPPMPHDFCPQPKVLLPPPHKKRMTMKIEGLFCEHSLAPSIRPGGINLRDILYIYSLRDR